MSGKRVRSPTTGSNKRRRTDGKGMRRPRNVRTPPGGPSVPRAKRSHPSTTPPVEPMNPANSPFPVGRLGSDSDSDATERYTPTYGAIAVGGSPSRASPQTTRTFTPMRTQTLPGQTEGSMGVTDQMARIAALGQMSPLDLGRPAMPHVSTPLVTALSTFGRAAQRPPISEAIQTLGREGVGAAISQAAATGADAVGTAAGTALGQSLGGLVGGPLGAALGGAAGGAIGRAGGRALLPVAAKKAGQLLETGGRAVREAISGRGQRARRARVVEDRRIGATKPDVTMESPESLGHGSPGNPGMPARVISGSGPGPQAPFVSSIFQGNQAFLDDDAPAGVPVTAKPRRGTVRVAAFAPLVPNVRGVGRFAIDPNSGFPFAGVNKSAVRSMQRAMRTPGPQLVF